jgi:predicted HTH transcriptional regulator
MILPKNLADVENLIRNQVQENIHLDYKDSRALTNNGARDSLAKDVSAFANSDGGLLIYGVEEKDNLPVRIDAGVDDAQRSREWIESAIMTGITPRLDDVKIVPVPVSAGHSLYVVETTKTFRGPHQSSDKRYYKRHNFKSVPMEDYEVNDVRNRRKQLSPLVIFKVSEYRRFVAAFDVGNVGEVVAEDVQFKFSAPMIFRWRPTSITPLGGSMRRKNSKTFRA